ncbi:single-stranded DNA-binding protein [uncultured Thomasclavelia sp.]|uniref:single-stranded DNA-binding protein n=1 Tax=uncultured Thomasclavelia sp. TaxID=3025759 RepID=UPI00280B309D|nr:single-stranded DNA-binding protein [uncultured Thomasclavelia sp.]
MLQIGDKVRLNYGLKIGKKYGGLIFDKNKTFDGENIAQYFRKGNRIAVQGRLQVSNYTDQQGNKRYSTDVIVEEFEFVESKNNGNGTVPSGFSIDSNAEAEDLPWQG